MCNRVLFVERSGELPVLARVRRRTFCRTVRRVMMSGKVKDLRSGAEAKASVKSTVESLIIDPKPGDLSMSRLKLP